MAEAKLNVSNRDLLSTSCRDCKKPCSVKEKSPSAKRFLKILDEMVPGSIFTTSPLWICTRKDPKISFRKNQDQTYYDKIIKDILTHRDTIVPILIYPCDKKYGKPVSPFRKKDYYIASHVNVLVCHFDIERLIITRYEPFRDRTMGIFPDWLIDNIVKMVEKILLPSRIDFETITGPQKSDNLCVYHVLFWIWNFIKRRDLSKLSCERYFNDEFPKFITMVRERYES